MATPRLVLSILALSLSLQLYAQHTFEGITDTSQSCSISGSPYISFVSSSTSTTVVKWHTRQIRYAINLAGSDDLSFSEVQGAVTSAFNSWATRTNAGFTFSAETVGSSVTKDCTDGHNTLYWDEASPIRVAQAITYLTYNKTTGELTDVDIGFNGNKVNASSLCGAQVVSIVWTTDGRSGYSNSICNPVFYADVQGNATHEIGHLLGLGHSTDSAATMYPDGRSVRQRTIAADDVSGVAALYPPVVPPRVIYESASLGGTGQTPYNAGGLGINYWPPRTSWYGARFTISQTTAVTAIGGHLQGGFVGIGNGQLFGAIIRLLGPYALPTGQPFDSNLVGSVLFTPPNPSADIVIPITAVLAPGYYGLLFGTGALGATGIANMPSTNTDLPGASYFEWEATPNPFTGQLLVLLGHKRTI